LADVVIVTSDNPRFEDPDKIIEEILEGLKNTKADLVVEPDRRTAIRKALGMTSRGDVLLIAGKGHETWQRVRERRIPFEDRKVVGEELP
jgi:UDP-N-acetylmuramoyl-L-alanyl-D-glutamate--2,6-diaminopimelate ligase